MSHFQGEESFSYSFQNYSYLRTQELKAINKNVNAQMHNE